MRPEEPGHAGGPGTGHPYAPTPYRVVRATPETSDTVTLVVEPSRGGPALRFAPGQFDMLYAFGVGEAAISHAGDPGRREDLTHTVRAVGAVTQALAKLRPGATVGVRGPYGTGWPLERARGRDVILVGGGLGFPPLRGVLLEILRRRAEFGRVEVICGARTPKDLIFYEELQQWRARDDLRVHVTVDAAGRDWYGDVGVVTQRLPDVRFDPARCIAFACGPEIMMRRTAEALVTSGVPAPDVFVSMERNMKCAVAQCGHCQFGPAFVCREGPVFDYARVRPMLAVPEL